MIDKYYTQDFTHEEDHEEDAHIVTIPTQVCAELDAYFENAQNKSAEIEVRRESAQMMAYHTAIQKGLVAEYSAHDSNSAGAETFAHSPSLRTSSSAHGAQTGSAHTFSFYQMPPIFTDPQGAQNSGDISTQSPPAKREFAFEKDVAERLDRCVRDHPTVDINNIVNQRVKDFLDEVDSAERG